MQVNYKRVAIQAQELPLQIQLGECTRDLPSAEARLWRCPRRSKKRKGGPRRSWMLLEA
jgi:hypothetical protein